MKDVTICSVNWNSEQLLNLNYKLVTEINKENFDWLIFDNTPNSKYQLDDRFKIEITPFENPTEIPENYVEFNGIHSKEFMNSVKHAVGLNHLIKKVKTRFVYLQDPDFYLVPKISDVIEYMKTNGLTFFGVPTHPYCYINNGWTINFPNPISMFIDMNKVLLQDLDFMPGYKGADSSNKSLPHPDTGIKISSKYAKSKKHECVIPVFIQKDTNISVEDIKDFPKYSKDMFYTKGAFNGNMLQWEEYYWKSKLFYGVHTRTRTKIDTTVDRRITLSQDKLDNHLLEIYLATNDYRIKNNIIK